VSYSGTHSERKSNGQREWRLGKDWVCQDAAICLWEEVIFVKFQICWYRVTFDLESSTLTSSTSWAQARLGTMVCKFGHHPAMCLVEEAISAKCLHTGGRTDGRTNGRRTDWNTFRYSWLRLRNMPQTTFCEHRISGALGAILEIYDPHVYYMYFFSSRLLTTRRTTDFDANCLRVVAWMSVPFAVKIASFCTT